MNHAAQMLLSCHDEPCPEVSLPVAGPEPNMVQGRKVSTMKIVFVFCNDAMRYAIFNIRR